MLPQPFIEEYWDRVSRILQEDYHLNQEQSQKAVSQYHALVEPKAGEMTYHQNAKEVAATISLAEKQ